MELMRFFRWKIVIVSNVKVIARSGFTRGRSFRALRCQRVERSPRCMGFHSARDQRMPARFICFDCRVRADQNWELIVLHDLYPRMMERFIDLAIFR